MKSTTTITNILSSFKKSYHKIWILKLPYISVACSSYLIYRKAGYAQRRRSWGGSRPPNENIGGGGQTYRFAPPPPNNFYNLKN